MVTPYRIGRKEQKYKFERTECKIFRVCLRDENGNNKFVREFKSRERARHERDKLREKYPNNNYVIIGF